MRCVGEMITLQFLALTVTTVNLLKFLDKPVTATNTNRTHGALVKSRQRALPCRYQGFSAEPEPWTRLWRACSRYVTLTSAYELFELNRLLEVRDTSHKPDEIYGIIERLAPGTRKLELFGRMHNIQVKFDHFLEIFWIYSKLINYFISQTGSL